MTGSYVVAGRRTLGKPLGIALIGIALFLAIASNASALTVGVGWTNPAYTEAEMPQVSHSGAQLFRVPLPPANNNDGIVAAGARNHVTIEANIGGGPALPAGSERTTFLAELQTEVERYGYGGKFWELNPSLPYAPITAWEIWNEPNNQGIGPAQFGTFVNEAAAAVQAGSIAKSGHGTEVVSGGLLVWGNLGGTKGNWEERGPDTYNGARKYLEEAFPYFGSNVTGVAIHPYELDETSFYTPPGGARYNRIQAFEYSVSGLHAALSGLGASQPLWITEAGWPAEGEYSVGTTEQANLLKASINYSRTNQSPLNLKAFIWYNLRDIPAEGHWDDYCGLRDHSGNYRPSWYTFQEETGASPWPTAPTAETGEAHINSETSATLHGTVNPQGAGTTYRFEYGTTNTYGHSVPVPAGGVGSGGEPAAVSQTITSLQPHTHYHYRIIASNSYGNAYGTDRTFTTGVKWLIRNSNSAGAPEGSFWFGLPGQIQLVGDWNGDGKTTVGLTTN